MGYRSDVHIAVAFASEADMKEVMAVYALDPRVQKHNLLEQWDIKDDNILYYHGDYVKWYDNYEDVQGIERLMEVADDFYSERGMAVAYRRIRIGEETDDLEHGFDYNGEGSDTLMELLWDRMNIVRSVEVTL